MLREKRERTSPRESMIWSVEYQLNLATSVFSQTERASGV